MTTAIAKSPPSLSFISPVGQHPGRPLFIFLPGMDGTGSLLSTQFEGLRHHVDMRCAILPPDEHQSWNSLAKQTIQGIQHELRQFGERDVYLCGESFGACLALKIITNAPSLIHRLIIVNPATAFRRFIWSNWAASSLKWLPDVSYPLACNILLPFLANLERVAAHDAQALLSAMQSVGYAVAAQRVKLLSQFEIDSNAYQRISHPTLILAGGSDRLLPSKREAHRLASLIPDSQIHVLPNSGHTCLLEQDVDLAAIMAARQFGINTAETMSCS